MAIDSDIQTLSKLDWVLKNRYAPKVRYMMKNADPMTKFINDATYEMNAGASMKIPLTYAPDGSIVAGDLTADYWANAGRSYGKSLDIEPADLVEVQGSLKIELKSRETLKKGGTTVGDMIKEQMRQQAQDLKRKAAMLTMMPTKGKIGSLSAAGSLSGGYVTMSATPLPHLFAPGMPVCGGTDSSGACTTIDWTFTVSHVDHANRRLYWTATPTSTGGVTITTNGSLASADGVWLYDAANTDEVPGMYSVPTWMNSTFTHYNVDRSTDTSWRFFSCEATDGGSDTITLSDLETSLINFNTQSGIVPDLGLVSPTVFKTIAKLEDDKKRLNLDPQEKPDFIMGYNRIWIMAGVGQVPLMMDPNFYSDRVYFLRRQDWHRLVLRDFAPEPKTRDGSIFYLDDDYAFIKARAWASWNYLCLDPAAQHALTGITA